MSGDESVYRLKRVAFKGEDVVVVLQNENGPCPLIAIANVLLLRRKLTIAVNTTEIPQARLITMVAEYLLDSNTVGQEVEHAADRFQNLDDAIQVLPKLTTGIDVNLRFHSCKGFEFTQEVAVFDLADITLVHGWLVDPQDVSTAGVLGTRSYNELIVQLVTALGSGTPKRLLSRETSERVSRALSGKDGSNVQQILDSIKHATQDSTHDSTVPADAMTSMDSELHAAIEMSKQVDVASSGMPQRSSDGGDLIQLDDANDNTSAAAKLDAVVDSLVAVALDTAAAEVASSTQHTTDANVTGSQSGHIAAALDAQVQGSTGDDQRVTAAPITATVVASPDFEATSQPVALRFSPRGEIVGVRLHCNGATTAATVMQPSEDTTASTAPQQDTTAQHDAAPSAPSMQQHTPPTIAETSAIASEQADDSASRAAAASVVRAVARGSNDGDVADSSAFEATTASQPPSLRQPSSSAALQHALIIQNFLDSTSSQLTVYGLSELHNTLREDELAVFFRNNHFNTVYKHGGHIYILVTDQGYLREGGVVWERLDAIDGDTHFYNDTFQTYQQHKAQIEAETAAALAQFAYQDEPQQHASQHGTAGGLPSDFLRVPQPPSQPPSLRTSPQLEPQYASAHAPQRTAAPSSHASVDADFALALQLQQQEEIAAQQAEQRAAQQQRLTQGVMGPVPSVPRTQETVNPMHQRQQQQQQQQQPSRQRSGGRRGSSDGKSSKCKLM